VARGLTLKTMELGDLDLYLIYQYGEVWEEEWRPLQREHITTLLTVVSQDLMDHALRGWTSPLVKVLGIPPEGAIRKLTNPLCYRLLVCPFYDKKSCAPTSPKMPWCFEPAFIEEAEPRQLAAELVRLWRQGVYVLVVTHANE